MARSPQVGSAAAEFWRFSLSFYALPGVADALIALQDRGGYDVNLILYGLWFGLAGNGRLDRDRIAAAERLTQRLRAEIVQPLRALRRSIEPGGEADLQRLRAAIARLELAAEKAVQRRLAASTRAPARHAATGRRRTDARANLLLYLGPDAARSGEGAVVLRALAAFPTEPPALRPRAPGKAARPSG
jgi:uncharacterized protein (TIGR02444 family)